MSTITVLDTAQEQLSTFRNSATDYGRLHQYQQLPNDEFTIPSQQTLIWKDLQKYNGNEACDGSIENCVFAPDNHVSLYESIPIFLLQLFTILFLLFLRFF